MPLVKQKLAFRGDSRPPHEIFPFGFRRRQDTWEYFEDKWRTYLDEAFGALLDGSDSDDDEGGDPVARYLGFTPHPSIQPIYPNLRYNDTGHTATMTITDSSGSPRPVVLPIDESPAELYTKWIKDVNKPYTLRSQGDIDPKSAICITDRLDVATIFPIPSEYPKWGRDSAWVYVVYADNVYVTWQQQVSMNTSLSKVLARSREIAARDVPSGHVIAAVRVYRRWPKKVVRRGKQKVDWRSGVSFVVSPFYEMNRKLENQPNYPSLEGWVDELLRPCLGKSYPCESFEELPDSVLG